MGEKSSVTGRELTREERRKAALRANLQRRKVQARARVTADSTPETGDEKEEG